VKIKQLCATPERYIQISSAAIRQGLKKPTAEFERAYKLSGKNKDL
jgi:hypothetical protein